MKAYSKDLRLKVLAAVDREMPRGEVAGTFGVSPATVKRWLKKRRETGDVDPEPIPGPPARKRAALEKRPPTQAKANPDLTLAEHCELFEEENDVRVSAATMSHASGRLGLPLKKSPSRLPSATRRRGLAGKEGRGSRPRAPRLRGRVRYAHLHDAPLREGAPRRAGLRQGVPQSRGRNTTL